MGNDWVCALSSSGPSADCLKHVVLGIGDGIARGDCSLCKTAYAIPPDQLIAHTATMMAALGAGMLCSSIWIAWVNTRRESSWFVMAMMLLVGLLMAAVAGVRDYHVALALTLRSDCLATPG